MKSRKPAVGARHHHLITIVLPVVALLLSIALCLGRSLSFGWGGARVDIAGESVTKLEATEPSACRPMPDETVLGNQRHNEYLTTVWYRCDLISRELAARWSVDTGNPPDDDHMKTIYESLQVCLRAIGFYRGDLNGDWRATNDAVLRFQRAKHLAPDGKVGRKTWAAILMALAEQVDEDPPSGRSTDGSLRFSQGHALSSWKACPCEGQDLALGRTGRQF